jgi:hypothetical protein
VTGSLLGLTVFKDPSYLQFTQTGSAASTQVFQYGLMEWDRYFACLPLYRFR